MKISQVQAFLLSSPLAEPLRLAYHGGERTILKRDALLIRVETDNGLVGYAPGMCTEQVRDAVNGPIAAYLGGRALGDPDALRIQFHSLDPAPDAHLKLIYGSVEIALYDLLGKAHGVPVSELLGGRVRDRIRLYGSAGMYQPPAAYAEEAAGIQALGFSAYKMRPALGPDDDLRTVELMRKATGPNFDLMIDAHSWWRMGDRSYSPQTVEQLARSMAAHDIAWLEEPILPDQHHEYARLRAMEIVPIASGEHEPSEERFLDLIENHCVDYVQMDVLCQGGYSVGRRIFAATAKHGLRFAFHSWGTDLEVIAAAQLGICWTEEVVEWLEYPIYSTPRLQTMYPFPLAQEILKTPLEITNGNLTVSHRPGLGVEVDESVIERYPWVPGPWSYFSLNSPQETFAVIGDHSVKFA